MPTSDTDTIKKTFCLSCNYISLFCLRLCAYDTNCVLYGPNCDFLCLEYVKTDLLFCRFWYICSQRTTHHIIINACTKLIITQKISYLVL